MRNGNLSCLHYRGFHTVLLHHDELSPKSILFLVPVMKPQTLFPLLAAMMMTGCGEEIEPITIPEIDLEMMPIPAGIFTMGSPDDEEMRRDSEGPQTKVTITKPFWLGKTEVTQSQWKVVMGNNPSHFQEWDDLPVETVSWNDAMAFCEKLNEMKRDSLPTGYHYTLPTEAQWEYACRAGTATRFYYGDDPDWNQLLQYARFTDNSYNKTHPVGKKLPNDWGLHDMYGNVSEWCLDRYRQRPSGRVSDPQGTDNGEDAGSIRALRGGHWDSQAWRCRSASTSGTWDDLGGDYHAGFRVALSSIPSE